MLPHFQQVWIVLGIADSPALNVATQARVIHADTCPLLLRSFHLSTPSGYDSERLTQFHCRCFHRSLRQLHSSFPND